MLHLLNHPLIKSKLTLMRKIETGTKDFRQNLDEIAGLMAYEITKDLPTRPVDIVTPMGDCVGQELDCRIVLVPVLRAGLGMVNGIQNLIPTCKIGHIGLYRNEETLEPVEYYAKFPKHMDESIVLILDPMLATGGSAKAAIDIVKNLYNIFYNLLDFGRILLKAFSVQIVEYGNQLYQTGISPHQLVRLFFCQRYYDLVLVVV